MSKATLARFNAVNLDNYTIDNPLAGMEAVIVERYAEPKQGYDVLVSVDLKEAARRIAAEHVVEPEDVESYFIRTGKVVDGRAIIEANEALQLVGTELGCLAAAAVA